MSRQANQTYFDSTPSQSLEFEEQLGMPELDDVKLRRTNPKRYDKRTDQTNELNEHVHDSLVVNRYDYPVPLETSGSMDVDELDWTFDRVVAAAQEVSEEDFVRFCITRHAAQRRAWDVSNIPKTPRVKEGMNVQIVKSVLPSAKSFAGMVGIVTHRYERAPEIITSVFEEVYNYEFLPKPIIFVKVEGAIVPYIVYEDEVRILNA